MATIAGLVVEISANTRGLKRSLQQAQGQVQRFAQSVKRRAAQIGKWLAGAFTVAAGAVALFIKKGLSSIDAQAKVARQLGTTAGELRGITQAASDAGVEQGRLESTLRSFSKRLGDTVNGTGEAQKAYEKLGIEASELARMPLPEQLALISERIGQLDSAAERASIADRLMSGGREMVNLFDNGGDKIRDAIQEVDDFGLALSSIETQRVEDANDAMSRIGNVVEAVRNRVTVALAPALERVASLINDAARESGGFKTAIESALAGAMEKAAGFLRMVDQVVLGLQKVQRFQLQTEALGATINNIATGSDELPEVFMRLQELERDMAKRRDRIENGSAATNFLESSASNLRESPAVQQLDRTAVNMSRIIGSESAKREKAGQGIEQFGQAANDAAGALRGLVPTGDQGAVPGVATPGDDSDSKKSQWSTWSSVKPMSQDEARQASSPTATGAASAATSSSVSEGGRMGGGRNLGTLTLKNDKGEGADFFTENADAAQKWLADTLSGASSSV